MIINTTLAGRSSALQARARIVNRVRNFFTLRGYLEVETPFRIPAPAPESHIDAIPASGWYLHTSPELCMKRMLAAGYNSIFQICRCWRAGERGSLHLPEFTMLEWYRAGCRYEGIMDDCEELFRYLSEEAGTGSKICFRGLNIDLSGKWDRMSVRDAFLLYGGTTMEKALESDRFDEVMVEAIEPVLGLSRPLFLCDYPSERSALARLKETDPSVAERFELYMGGLEIANAFSELTDVQEQRERFVQESSFRNSIGKDVYPLPEKFLEELESMPSAAGIALGLDRLVMVLLDKYTIDEVVAFTPEEL